MIVQVAQGAAETVGDVKARDLLRDKGQRVITIGPDQPILDAIRTIAEHSIGALLVVDERQAIVGILSERDILRWNATHFDCMAGAQVKDLMSRQVIIALADDSLNYVMRLMTDRHIRHVPILEDGLLAGILSIGDVVKRRAHHAEVHVRYLTDYIAGQYPV